MKRLLQTLLLCGLIVSCSNPTHFTINGTLDNSFHGDSIYLCTLPDMDTVAAGTFTDSTSFFIEGEVQNAAVAFLRSSSRKTTTTFVLEKGNLRIGGSGDSLLVTGTPLNDIYNRFLTDNAGKPEDTVNVRLKELIVAHSSDALGTMLGRSVAYSLSAGEFVELYDNLDRPMRQDPFFEKLYKRSSRRMMTVGAMFSEIVGEIDGKPARLSDYAGRGDWVLLSFWASWCGDCKADMPKLRKMYDILRQENVKVIGIARNDKPEAMKAAMKRYDMVWPVFSNTNNREAYSYSIITIPSLVLIDPEGAIVDIGDTCTEFLPKIRAAQASYRARK